MRICLASLRPNIGRQYDQQDRSRQPCYQGSINWLRADVDCRGEAVSTGQWNNNNAREDAVSYLKSQEYECLSPRLNSVIARLTPFAGPVEPSAEVTTRRHRHAGVLPPPRKRSATATDWHTLQKAALKRMDADIAMMASARWERVHADLKVIWQIYVGGKFIDLSSLVVLPRTTSRPAVPIAPIQPPAAVLPKAPASVISVS